MLHNTCINDFTRESSIDKYHKLSQDINSEIVIIKLNSTTACNDILVNYLKSKLKCLLSVVLMQSLLSEGFNQGSIISLRCVKRFEIECFPIHSFESSRK